MQLDAQLFLDIVEKANRIAFVDIETTGLRGDYNSVLVTSVRPYRGKPQTFRATRPGDDESVVLATKEAMDRYACWVTYYGKGFDVPLLNTRLLRWGQPPLAYRHHLDLYYMLRYHILTSRRSQAHLLTWAKTFKGDALLDPMPQKMSISAELWNLILADPEPHMPVMMRRCDSDTAGLRALYRKTRHLVREIQR